MSDNVVLGRRIRKVNVMDDCIKESLLIEIDTSHFHIRVIRTLERIIEDRGKSSIIFSNNGSEFTSKILELCCQDKEITLQFIQHGKPAQNGFIEIQATLLRIGARCLSFL